MIRACLLLMAFTPAVAFAQSGTNSEWSTSTYRPQLEPAGDVIGNDDVIQLIVSGVSDMVIMSMIRNSETDFDLSSNGLIDLSSAGVSQPVMTAMISRAKAANRRPLTTTRRAQALPPLSQDSPEPLEPHVPGVYLLNASGSLGKMRRVEPVEAELEGRLGGGGGGLLGGGFMSAAAKGIIGGGLTGGLMPGLLGGGGGGGGGGARAKIKGSNALIQTTLRSPVFFIYFDESVPEPLRSHAPTIWAAGGGSVIATPHDLKLVQFEEKKGYREARIGHKIKERDEILFSTEMMGPGIYKLTVRSHLQSGEYGFVQSLEANDGRGQDAARIFDFEVR